MGPVMILQSPDARVCISRRHTTMTHFVRNADGDEMIFVHQGQGRLETDYGLLPYEPGAITSSFRRERRIVYMSTPRKTTASF